MQFPKSNCHMTVGLCGLRQLGEEPLVQFSECFSVSLEVRRGVHMCAAILSDPRIGFIDVRSARMIEGRIKVVTQQVNLHLFLDLIVLD